MHLKKVLTGFLLFAVPTVPIHAAVSVERAAGSPGDLSIGTEAVTLEDNTLVEVEAGQFLVPENRNVPNSPVVSLPFYRLRSTTQNPANPIFLLAGGPGSSWIDRFENLENFNEVRFYQTFADVVLFDQRGAGHSLPKMSCDERQTLPLTIPLDPSTVASKLQEMSQACRDHWIEAGVDLSGYTTEENVDDVLELASALGYSKINLVGGSYGSHLALALMRAKSPMIGRVVLYGIEGLDQTWDDPGARLATYERIAGSIAASDPLGASIPESGLLESLREVIQRLEAEPVLVSIGEGEEETKVLVDAEVVRRVAGFQAGRRSRPNAWPEFILDLVAGDYSFVARGAIAVRSLRLHHPMHYMMDCASGISPARAKRYRTDPAREILGDINFEYEALCGSWQAPDLGPEFRAPLFSEIPTLMMHGTWDTSTPIENAREVIATLPNGHLVEVIGGSHGALYNLYEEWKPMKQRLATFLKGGPLQFPSSVTLRAPEYQALGDD